MSDASGGAGDRREILVVRHGEAYNTVAPDGRREVADRSNPPLTPRGEAQAALVAPVVTAFAPDAAVSSPFLRAAQTGAAALAEAPTTAELDVRMSEHFHFAPLAAFAGVDLEDYRARFGARYAFPDDLADRASFPGFPEDEASVVQRVASLADAWTARDGWRRAAFFGHGATVGALVGALVPRVAGSVPEPSHCSVTHLVEQPGGAWEVVTLCDVAHLAAAAL